MMVVVLCTAFVHLEQRHMDMGYTAHPAVSDNCIQLGPATGMEGQEPDAKMTTTRVVGGMAAFRALPYNPHGPNWTATERAPANAANSIMTSHWMRSGHEPCNLTICDLEVQQQHVVVPIVCSNRYCLSGFYWKYGMG